MTTYVQEKANIVRQLVSPKLGDRKMSYAAAIRTVADVSFLSTKELAQEVNKRNSENKKKETKKLPEQSNVQKDWRTTWEEKNEN